MKVNTTRASTSRRHRRSHPQTVRKSTRNRQTVHRETAEDLQIVPRALRFAPNGITGMRRPKQKADLVNSRSHYLSRSYARPSRGTSMVCHPCFPGLVPCLFKPHQEAKVTIPLPCKSHLPSSLLPFPPSLPLPPPSPSSPPSSPPPPPPSPLPLLQR